MDAGSEQFADLSSESRLANLEVEEKTGVEAYPGVLALVSGRPCGGRTGPRARIDKDPAVARTVVDERGVVLVFLRARGGDASKGAAGRLTEAFADDPQVPPRRWRDRVAPGDRGDPARPSPRGADRFPARLPALVLGLPWPRCRLSAAPRRCRRDRAHLPRSPHRDRGALAFGLRPQPRHGSRARPGDRLLALHRLALARGGGTSRPRARGARPRRCAAAGRTVVFSAVTVAASMACLLVFPQQFLYSMGLGGVLVALSAGLVALVPLPAFLYWLGPRIDALAPRRLQQLPSGGRWGRLAAWVMRRPGRVAALSASVPRPARLYRRSGFTSSASTRRRCLPRQVHVRSPTRSTAMTCEDAMRR